MTDDVGPNHYFVGHALRSGPHHARAFNEMVLAEGVGDEDREAARHEEGDCRPGTAAGRDPAPRLGRRQRVPVEP